MSILETDTVGDSMGKIRTDLVGKALRIFPDTTHIIMMDDDLLIWDGDSVARDFLLLFEHSIFNDLRSVLYVTPSDRFRVLGGIYNSTGSQKNKGLNLIRFQCYPVKHIKRLIEDEDLIARVHMVDAGEDLVLPFVTASLIADGSANTDALVHVEGFEGMLHLSELTLTMTDILRKSYDSEALHVKGKESLKREALDLMTQYGMRASGFNKRKRQVLYRYPRISRLFPSIFG